MSTASLPFLMSPVGRAQAVQVSNALLDLVRPTATTAWVDAPTDFEQDPSDEARTSRAWLERRSEDVGSGSGMGVEVDPAQAAQWGVLRAYAPYSIHVEVHAERSSPRQIPLASLHDGASVISANLTDQEARSLGGQLYGVADVVPWQPRRWWRPRSRLQPVWAPPPQPAPVDTDVIALLTLLDGRRSTVELTDDRVLEVWNIAWGYDMGDEHAHVTTNCSPFVEGANLDFFYTRDIRLVIDDHGLRVYTRRGGAPQSADPR